jgi:hypothetical protein
VAERAREAWVTILKKLYLGLEKSRAADEEDVGKDEDDT